MAPKEAKKGQAAKKVAQPKKDNKKRKNDEQHGQRCNMLGQLKHAESALEALKKKQEEGALVDPAKIADLNRKVDFRKAYQALGEDAEGKANMLSLWTEDKTCKKWSVAQQEQGEDGGGEGLWTQGLLLQKLVLSSSHFSYLRFEYL